MWLKYFKIIFIVCLAVVFLNQRSFCQDSIQYKNIKVKKASCDVGILYKQTPKGMDVEVSAIATGKGSDFRGWEITTVKLNLEGDILRPVKTEKFYVTKESFFQGAAPLVFAAIGSQYERYANQAQSGGICPITGDTQTTHRKRNSFGKAIDKTGMAAGMGLLASQAKGEITGLKCTFGLDNDMMDKINNGNGLIKIALQNKDKHQVAKTNIPIPQLYATKVDMTFDFAAMKQNDLLKLANTLDDEIRALEKDQKAYRYNDPRYIKIQNQIKNLRVKRDAAQKEWSDRHKKWIEGQKGRIAKKKEALEKEEEQRTKEFEDYKKWQKEQEAKRQREEEEKRRKAAEEEEKKRKKRWEKYEKSVEETNRRLKEIEAEKKKQEAIRLQEDADKKTYEVYKWLSYHEHKAVEVPKEIAVTPPPEFENTTWGYIKAGWYRIKKGVKGAWDYFKEERTKAPIPTDLPEVVVHTYSAVSQYYDPNTTAGRFRMNHKLRELQEEQGWTEGEFDTMNKDIVDMHRRIQNGTFVPPEDWR